MPKSYYYICIINVVKNDFIQVQHISFQENEVSGQDASRMLFCMESCVSFTEKILSDVWEIHISKQNAKTFL